MRHAALLPVFALLMLPAAPRAAAVPPKVPEGFVIERVDTAGQIRFPMFAAFDERGRLFVTESSGLDLYAEITALTRKCRVSVLEDKDGDGRFETSGVFADGLVMPMGAEWRDGRLYVPDGPDLITLEDTDGDGRADKRTAVLSGFGHTDNGGLHGVIFGPDGWLYMTCGQPDGYRIRRSDGSWMESRSGSLLRCRPDGSDPQCLSRGFENLVEVAFLGGGDVIGTVNWYQKPEGGIRDALVHLAHGGLYPYVPDVGTSQLVSGPVLPALAKFPAVALSGLAVQEGDGLGADYVGNLFSAQHNTRNVGRHVLSRDGATFRSEDSNFVTSDDPDFHPSDVLFDADGSLVVVDTGSWYIHHCPTGQIRNSPATGGVYRVRRAGALPAADPRGLKIDWQAAAPAALVDLLADPRPAVRERARLTLGSRGGDAVPAMVAALRTTDAPVKQRVLWALCTTGDGPAAAPLRAALDADDPDVAATAARALGARGDRSAAADLTRVLTSPAPVHVRSAAAEALAYCGDRGSLPALWAAMAAAPAGERFLEHALVYAAHHLGDADALTEALSHPRPRVQAAALLLLDQPPRPPGALAAGAAFDRLAADDEYLRQVALGRIERHPEWAAHALDLLRRSGPADLAPEQERRTLRLFLAFEKNPDVQALTAAQLLDDALPVGRRARLLDALSQSRLADPPDALVDALRRLMDHADDRLAGAATKAAVALRPKSLDDLLAAVAADRRRAAAVRLDALRAVLPRRPRLDAATFHFLMSRLGPGVDPLDRLAAASLVGRARLDAGQAGQLLARVAGDALVSPSTILPALAHVSDPAFNAALVNYVKAAVARGWEPPEAQLAPVLAGMPAGPAADELRAAVRAASERRAARLAEYEPLLAGGDPGRGRSVFFSNKVACGTCHRVGTEGGHVGPDLTKVGAVRAGRDILESVVLPSSTIAQGFDHYVVQTKGGEVHAGIVLQPSADVLEVRDSAGNMVRVHRDDVARLKRQPMSLMPDGLPNALTRDEFSDLLAYLQSLR